MPADFKILRGSAVIPSGEASLALSDGVDYALEPGLADDAWFFGIASSHFSGMGRTSGGGNQNADDHTCWITQSGNDVTINRSGTTNNCRVDWQIVQYIGAVGGPNEIKVRAKGTLTGTGPAATVALPGLVANSSDLVPWITSQAQNGTGRNNINRSLFTSEIAGGDALFNRFTAVSTFWLSYALVEFIGSDWQISNEQFANSGSGFQSIGLANSVDDIAQTFLHSTYRYETNGTVGLDDASVRVRLTAPDTFETATTTSTDLSLKRHSVWLIQNPSMSVSRYTGTMAGTGEEEVFNVPISAVGDPDQAITTLTNDCTGSGTAFPRGFINHVLTANDNVLLRQSDNGQTSRYAIEVVELPQSSTPPEPDPTLITRLTTHSHAAAAAPLSSSAATLPALALHGAQSTSAVLLTLASLAGLAAQHQQAATNPVLTPGSVQVETLLSATTHQHVSTSVALSVSATLDASPTQNAFSSSLAAFSVVAQLGASPLDHGAAAGLASLSASAMLTASTTILHHIVAPGLVSQSAAPFPQIAFRVERESRASRIAARKALVVKTEARGFAVAGENRAFSVKREVRSLSIKKANS